MIELQNNHQIKIYITVSWNLMICRHDVMKIKESWRAEYLKNNLNTSAESVY